MSEDMPQVPNGFGLHAKRALEIDPVARLQGSDGGRLSRLAAELFAVAPQKDKRRVSISKKRSRAESAYRDSGKECYQVIARSLYSLSNSLRSLRRLATARKPLGDKRLKGS
jgi:hypothetical protein